jgi:hypothetical protein
LAKIRLNSRQNTKSLGLDQLYIPDFSGVGLCGGKLLLG